MVSYCILYLGLDDLLCCNLYSYHFCWLAIVMFDAICYNYVVCLSACRCRSVIITVAFLWWFSPWFNTESINPDSKNDFVGGGLILPNFFSFFIQKNHHFWLRGIEIHKFLKVFRVGQVSIFRELFVENT